MALHNDTKLKNLLTTWPHGTVCLASELKQRGIGYDLQMQYKRSGWIRAIGQGAVAKSGDNVFWYGGLYALQTQGKLPIHVGAKTALTMYGLAHFVDMAHEKVQLFGLPGTKLPSWFKNFNWGPKIEYYRSSLFSGNANLGLQNKSLRSFDIKISSPERAFLELLDLVPQNETFNEALLISESLSTFRPKLVQQLLESCSSIKVKRLFLYLVEKQGHGWTKKLHVEKIDLGKGDRQIIKGGMIDHKYRITVPQEQI